MLFFTLRYKHAYPYLSRIICTDVYENSMIHWDSNNSSYWGELESLFPVMWVSYQTVPEKIIERITDSNVYLMLSNDLKYLESPFSFFIHLSNPILNFGSYKLRHSPNTHWLLTAGGLLEALNPGAGEWLVSKWSCICFYSCSLWLACITTCTSLPVISVMAWDAAAFTLLWAARVRELSREFLTRI